MKNASDFKTCKSVNFFCYYIFREENSPIYFLTKNTHKVTLCYICDLDLCTYLEFLIMHQQKPGNNSHIPVDTPPKLNVYKMFLRRLGRHINILYTFF